MFIDIFCRMTDPPKKKFRQFLLNGALSIKGGNECLYPNPTSAHERFMNAYFQACDITFTRAHCQQLGMVAWKQIKGDIELQDKFTQASPQKRMTVLQQPNVTARTLPNFFVNSTS